MSQFSNCIEMLTPRIRAAPAAASATKRLLVFNITMSYCHNLVLDNQTVTLVERKLEYRRLC